MRPIPKNENSEIAEIHQKSQNTEVWKYNFKSSWNAVQISKWSSHIANHVTWSCFLRATDSSRFIESFVVVAVVVYFSFNAQKVEIEIEKKIHMHLNIVDWKMNIFCNFQFFVLSPILKYENSETTEMLQKRQNTEIWECNIKNSSDALRITPTLNWFSHIPNEVPSACLLRSFNSSRFIKLGWFLFIYF